MYIQVRDSGLRRPDPEPRGAGPGLSAEQTRQLAIYAIAGADGLFIAKEIGGDSVDLNALFAVHGRALYDTALRMIEENDTP